MRQGSIIILNGVSSSGKTTLAKILQERLSKAYFNMDVDVFCNMSPASYCSNDYSLQWNFVSNMFHAVKLYSDMGFNLVVPCIFWFEDFFVKCVSLLHSYPVLFVHVKCPVEELRRREIERGDRPVGMAEGLLKQLKPQDIYDITVDTYKNTLEECADMIVNMVESSDSFSAFKTLWSQYVK